MPEHDGYPALKQGVRLAADARAPHTTQLTAVVEAVSAEGALSLRCLDASKVGELTGGDLVTLEYFRHGSVYKLRSTVAQIEANAAGVRIDLAVPRDLKKVQRRSFPRAMVSVPLAFVAVDVPDKFDGASWSGRRTMAQWVKELAVRGYKGVTETLSGSGLRLRTPGRVSRGEHLLIVLEIPEHALQLVGKVVWLKSGAPPQEAPGEVAGIEFIGVTQKERDVILQFVGGAIPTP